MNQIVDFIQNVTSVQIIDIIIAVTIILFFRIFSSVLSYIIIRMFKFKTKNSKKIKESAFYKPLRIFFIILGFYIAVLESPDINLKRGLVDYNSKYNDVKYNIQIIEKSNMPDKPNGNFILAGHNGTSSVSFFRNLNKLTTDSLINIYYKGYKYIYKFNNSYEVDKDGEIEIKRDINKNTITLITCKKNSKTKQVVNIGYLVDKVEY